MGGLAYWLAVLRWKTGREILQLKGLKAVAICDLDAKCVAATFQGEEAFLRLAFSPDGSRLASGGRSGAIVLWDVAAATKGK